MDDVFTDLDTSTIKPRHAVVHVAEFLVWWHFDGRRLYGRGRHDEDEELINLAGDAVVAAGGWRAARRLIRSSDSKGVSVESHA